MPTAQRSATDLLVRRGLRERVGRYVATGLAVVLGVALAVGSLLLTDTLRELLRAASPTAAADLVVRSTATFDLAATRDRLPCRTWWWRTSGSSSVTGCSGCARPTQ